MKYGDHWARYTGTSLLHCWKSGEKLHRAFLFFHYRPPCRVKEGLKKWVIECLAFPVLNVARELLSLCDFRITRPKSKPFPLWCQKQLWEWCDTCNARAFDPRETKRWQDLFYQRLEDKEIFYSREEIKTLRESLGLSVTDFAHLIGCTRQSIYNWERQDRINQQTRTADLMMKLMAKSLVSEPIDIISFLLKEAEKMGVKIELQRSLV